MTALPRVLVVDDEPANLRTFLRCFRADAEVLTAESGADALELLATIDVDAVLTDFSMPGMNGVELLQRVAQRCPRARRLLVTGHVGAIEIDAAIASGIVERAVAKPWARDEVRALLASFV